MTVSYPATESPSFCGSDLFRCRNEDREDAVDAVEVCEVSGDDPLAVKAQVERAVSVLPTELESLAPKWTNWFLLPTTTSSRARDRDVECTVERGPRVCDDFSTWISKEDTRCWFEVAVATLIDPVRSGDNDSPVEAGARPCGLDRTD